MEKTTDKQIHNFDDFYKKFVAEQGPNLKVSPMIKEKIRKIFDEYHEAVLTGKKVSLKSLQRKYGYSNKSNVALTKTWKEMLSRINEESLLDKINDIAINSKSESNSLRAIEMALKLKGRFPDQKKSSGSGFQMQINNLLAEDKDDKPNYIEVNETKQISED